MTKREMLIQFLDNDESFTKFHSSNDFVIFKNIHSTNMTIHISDSDWFTIDGMSYKFENIKLLKGNLYIKLL